MNNLIIGMIALFAALFLSRSISEKALKKLSQDKKASFIDLFSNERKYSFIILAVIILFYLLNATYGFMERNTSLITYIVLLLAYIMVKSFMTYTKLKKNDFPTDYIKSYLQATFVVFIGFLFFFGSILLLLK